MAGASAAEGRWWWWWYQLAGTTEWLAAITARRTLLAGRERRKCVHWVAGVPTRHCVLAGMAGGTRDSMAEPSCLAVCSIRT